MSEKNLLITIVDTNPVWWNLQSSGALDSLSGTKESSSHKSDKVLSTSIESNFNN